MATEREDTLKPSGTSGSGFHGVDTATVKAEKAPKSLIHDNKEEILRLSVKGFNFSRSSGHDWEDVMISRAGHRKVAIQLLDVRGRPPDREKEPRYVVRKSFHNCSINYIGL